MPGNLFLLMFPAIIKLIRQFFEAWQPYLQTNAMFFSESKSVAAAIDLERTDEASMEILQRRLG